MNDERSAQDVPQGTYSGPLMVAFWRPPLKLLKSSCNTPYVIIQSSTTGISFQHLNLLLFPTVGKNFRGNIELQWPRRRDCLGSKISLVARPEISTKKRKKKHYKHFWPHISWGSWVATLIQNLPTQPLMVMILKGFLVFMAGRTDKSDHFLNLSGLKKNMM